MLINELQDECLLTIFNHINDLDDLINCFKVSNKWSCLVAERTRKVKYLLDYPVSSVEYAYYQGKEPIDGTVLSKLFGNLIIADLSVYLEKNVKLEYLNEMVKNQKSLKAMIHSCYRYVPVSDYPDTLEMLSSDFIEPKIQRNGSILKQLHLWDFTLDSFKENAHHFPNLERLYIYNNEGRPDHYYDGPIMEKLKIVELSLSSYDSTDTYYGFQFMDSCPNLQSAHIEVNSDRLLADEKVKHKSLQDLVLYFFYSARVDGKYVENLLMKYPSLKHLSLRGNLSLNDKNIKRLVRILPNLVLLDVRGCPKVTRQSADYVRDYCKRYGKAIKFYFDENKHEIETDWPQLSIEERKISRGFDFMKHCFLKDFHHLSTFLVPIDYYSHI